MNVKQILQLTIATLISLVLVGCANDPMSRLPANQQAQLVAQVRAGNKMQDGSSKITLAELMAQMKAEHKHDKHNAVTETDYYLRLDFDKGQNKLNARQRRELSAVLAKLPDPKKYLVQLTSGPGAREKSVMSLFLSEQRMKHVTEALTPVVSKVNSIYNPKLPAGEMDLSFLVRG